jgi:capsular polysaccharide biosynthesis protein
MEASALATVGRALRWQHRLVWGCALVAVVLAAAAIFVRDPTYTATAMLNIDESQNTSQGFDLALQADQYLSQRYIDMATSQAVLRRVCAQEGQDCSTAALARQVSANTTKATGQILVSATAPTAQAAARLANEEAKAILAENRAYVTSALSQQQQLLQRQLDTLGQQMTTTQRAIIAAHQANQDNSGLLSQLTLQQNQYQTTYSHLQDLQVQQTQLISGLTISQPATPPARPSDPDPVRYLLVGLVAGLVVGLLAALLAERLRKRIMEGAELAEVTGCDLVLAVDQREAPVVMGSYGLLSPQGDLPEDAEGAQLLLVAASPAVPVDDLAMDLAGVIGGERRRVLVVPAGPGRSVREVDDRSSGRPLPTRPRASGARADLTIRCASPLARPALWLKPSAGPAILVASRGLTRFSEARRTAELLRHLGLEPVAAVLLTGPGAVTSTRARGLAEAPTTPERESAGGASESEASAS